MDFERQVAKEQLAREERVEMAKLSCFERGYSRRALVEIAVATGILQKQVDCQP